MVNNTSKCYSVLRDPAVTAWGKTKTKQKKNSSKFDYLCYIKVI